MRDLLRISPGLATLLPGEPGGGIRRSDRGIRRYGIGAVLGVIIIGWCYRCAGLDVAGPSTRGLGFAW